MAEFETLKFERKDNIAIVTVNRPKAMNALNSQVLDELRGAFHEIAQDEGIRAVILTGEGKAFVAGADIAEMSKLNAVEARAFAKKGHAVMNFIENIEKPVIAAVNGFALGGGCELAMACDIRIASEKAKFGQPEVGLGLIPGFGGNLRLRSATPLGNADGGSLHTSSGDNPNPLMQPYLMPAPIVEDSTKIPATTLPKTFLYDIPTLPGQVITLIPHKG